jgi:NADH-quinone oxidoreductase subunit M
MILLWLILWLMAGGLLAWLVGRWHKTWARWLSRLFTGTYLLAVVLIWIVSPEAQGVAPGNWLIDLNLPWIPNLGIRLHLALDGLGLLLLVLVGVLGVVSVATSWVGVQQRVGFFHFNLLWILAALAGVFMAMDLVLFYLFWEMMLIPLYFLIGIWGYENRVYATIKFFIFTQAGGLLMLLSILGLYFVHGNNTGVYTFDYFQLLGSAMPLATAVWLMLGFFVAFAVKLPAVSLHTWLPDAHTQAPTAGSVVLAGLVLKAGAYGLFRFLVPLFPEAAAWIAPAAVILGVIGILYGALQAYGQTDLKRLVAYTSVSHMGFVLLGVFAWNPLALQGVVVVMIAHGISTGALFILAGDIQERIHSRDLERMGGLWSTVPRMGAVGLLFALASLGLPGLGNFVGEFLVLLGAFQANVPIAIVATLAFVVSAVYSLSMVQRVFLGPERKGQDLPDTTAREMAIWAAMIALIVILGLYPGPVIDTARPAVETMQDYAAAGEAVHIHRGDARVAAQPEVAPRSGWVPPSAGGGP